MAARRNSPVGPQHVDPQHTGSALFRGRDTSSMDSAPRRTTSPPPKPWWRERLLVCEQRSARTKPSYLRTESTVARMDFSTARPVRFPDIFLAGYFLGSFAQ